MIPPVPGRSTDALRLVAEEFLTAYHPSGDPPIPIEELVEFDLGLEIRPIRALRQRFGIEGYLSTDLQTIVVDETLLTHHITRYRFTLAHEIGHLVLHPDQVHAVESETEVGWKAAVQSIAPGDYGRMEFQAYEFAGCILVPRRALLTSYQDAARLAEERGIDLAELQDASLDYVAGWIARRFEVSANVVKRRLEREGLMGGSP